MLYLIMGRSGSGKTTIAQKLKDEGYKGVKSYTTRPRRDGESEDAYNFISEEEYAALPNKIAPVFFNGYHYCSTIDDIKEAELYVAEPSAVRELRTAGIDFKVLFIAVSKNTAIERMKKRGDSQEKIDSRIKNDEIDFGVTSIANPKVAYNELGKNKVFYFHNKNLDECVNAILLHLKGEKYGSEK